MNMGTGRGCKILFLKNARAVIGYGEDEFQRNVFTWLKIWHLFSDSDFRTRDFYQKICKDVALEIIAGPFSEGVWAYGLGQKLTETVKIKFGYEAYHNGFRLDDPIILFLTAIMHTASRLIEDKPPAELSYWEAFKNPGLDYKKP